MRRDITRERERFETAFSIDRVVVTVPTNDIGQVTKVRQARNLGLSVERESQGKARAQFPIGIAWRQPTPDKGTRQIFLHGVIYCCAVYKI